MADHDLLQAFAAHEREALQSRPAEWDAFARGEIDADEVARRLRDRGTSEAEIARGLELFAPLSAAFDDALVAKLLAPPEGEREAPAAPPNVVDRSDASWWRRRSVAWVGVVAAAAAIAVFAWPRSPVSVDTTAPSLVQLPTYDMSIQAAATVRGSADEAVHVPPGSQLTLLLRPARAHTTSPSVAACVRRDGEVRVLAATPKLGKPGEGFEVDVALPDDLADGPAEIVAVVAGGPLPTDVAAVCASGRSDLQLVRKPITVGR